MPRLYLLGGALRCGRLGRPARSGDSFTDSEPGAMAERRPERVAHLVQAELAALFLRQANDPRLRDLTVTAVRMSPDLRVARVYVRTLVDTTDARAAALRALARAATFLRGRVGGRSGCASRRSCASSTTRSPTPPAASTTCCARPRTRTRSD